MKRGFSLTEVMVVMAIVCIISVGAIKLLMASNQAGKYSDNRTYASVLASSKIFSLKKLPLSNSEIATGWHTDKGNPIVQDSISYYRYWTVSLAEDGSRMIKVRVAWNEEDTDMDMAFASEDEFAASSCSRVEFSGRRDTLMP